MKNKDLDILKKFNILYLEDDEDLRVHTTDTLEDFMNNIYSVSTTKEALNIILNQKIDIIVSDILLENENGIDFLKFLKDKKGIAIPIILTTAYSDTQYLLDAIKLKIENYIIKPININELLDTIYDVLLPIFQETQIKKNKNIIKIISAITDSKQVEVINFIFNNLNQDNIFVGSYSEIMLSVNISKPTLVKLFKELSAKKILVKIQHKTYRFDEKAIQDF